MSHFLTYPGSDFAYSHIVPTMDDNDEAEEMEDQLELGKNSGSHVVRRLVMRNLRLYIFLDVQTWLLW